MTSSDAAPEAHPEAFARMMPGSEHMMAMFELLRADEDGGPGEGHWAECVRLAPPPHHAVPGYAFEYLAKIGAPTLIIIGDSEDKYTLDDGVGAHRQLVHGEIAVLPGTGPSASSTSPSTTFGEATQT